MFHWTTVLGAFVLLAAWPTTAADFRSTADNATVLYDAPSLKAKRLFVVSRETPLEVIVNLEGWLKVRDVSGTIAWVEKKALSTKRVVIVRVPSADVHASPDLAAPVVFRADQNVLLELLDGEGTDTLAGWAHVRHRDGQSGYVRIAQLWGV